MAHALLVFAGSLLMALCVPASGAGESRPAVSRREADLIARAHTLAETDVTAAIRLIEDHDDGNLNPALDFVLGNLHVQADALEFAAARFEQAIDKHAAFIEARRNLGRVFLLMDRPAAAAALFRFLAVRSEAGADDFLLLGHSDFLADRPVAAEASYRQALLRDPGLDDAVRGLVKTLVRQARYAEAAALCYEQLERLPTDAELWSLRANALLALDRTSDTIRALETAERLGALDDRHRMLLADLYINARQPADALRLYHAALRADSPPEAALRAARGFLMLGDTGRAREMLDGPALRDRQLAEQDRHARQRLRAEAALLDEDYAALHDHLSEVLEDAPLDGDSLLLKARAEAAQGHFEAAAMAYERAARIPAIRIEALRAHARIEAGRARYGEAIRLLEAAHILDPHPDYARYLEQIRRLEQIDRRARPQQSQ